MSEYGRDYDREYEGDYDDDKERQNEIDDGSTRHSPPNSTFASSLPTAAELENAIAMKDVNDPGSSFTIFKGVQNKRRLIIASTIALVFAIVAIAIAVGVDTTPAPAYASSAAASESDTSAPPTTKSKNTTSLYHGKTCVGERLVYNNHLKPHEFICSKLNSFVMGLNKNRDLVWVDLSTNDTKTYFTNKPQYYKAEHFVLTLHGKFEIQDSLNQTIWKLQTIYGEKILPVSNNTVNGFDTPYLRLHDDGVVVLNWVNHTTNAWMEHNIDKLYDFLGSS